MTTASARTPRRMVLRIMRSPFARWRNSALPRLLRPAATGGLGEPSARATNLREASPTSGDQAPFPVLTLAPPGTNANSGIAGVYSQKSFRLVAWRGQTVRRQADRTAGPGQSGPAASLRSEG